MEIDKTLLQPSFQEIEQAWQSYFFEDLRPETAQRWSECSLSLLEKAFSIASEKLNCEVPEKKAAAYVTGILRNSVIGTARKDAIAKVNTSPASYDLYEGWKNAEWYKEAFPKLFGEDNA